jgi:phosphohistidine swiveling domain-containing protein
MTVSHALNDVGRFTVDFGDEASSLHDVVGGKGANLGKLTRAGFEVPPGFCVTTAAFRAFLSAHEMQDRIDTILGHLDYADQSEIESATASVRELFTSADLPGAVADAIRAAYAKLGADIRVAVRSSGTAEDLADASFAGLHDTFLHVQSADDVLDAVRRCWASIWSARAVVYRQRNGFDHRAAEISVVVQTMVDATVSGVMFTGNPITTATDEIVINSSWGLGEAIVAGLVTPDTYLARHWDATLKEKTLGSKAKKIVLDPVEQRGTVEVTVSDSESQSHSLTDDEVAELARLGRRVQDYYGGFPQDIEWARAGNRFYLLQSRPVTGVEFSWDADLEVGWTHEVDESDLYTRSFADYISTGAISPLMYTYRYYGFEPTFDYLGLLFGVEECRDRPPFQFRKAEIYYSCKMEAALAEKTTVPFLRNGAVGLLPESWANDVLQAPFGLPRYLKTWLRAVLVDDLKGLGRGFQRNLEAARSNPLIHGLSYDELALLSDAQLKKHIVDLYDVEIDWGSKVITPMFVHFRDAVTLLGWIIAKWYSGENKSAFANLISGSVESTDTQVENAKLWELAQKIRNSERLANDFEKFTGAEFFDHLESHEEGRSFLALYSDFISDFGHRGHTDRDIVYPRRSEDPNIDYRSFSLLLRDPNPTHPLEREHTVNAKRQAALSEVCANVGQGSFGSLKATLVKFLYSYIHDVIHMRDNERNSPADVTTMSYKRGHLEMGRRLCERGLIAEREDIYYLGRPEAESLLDGNTSRLELLHAKIAARKRDFLRFYNKEIVPPMFIRDYRVVEESVPSAGPADPNNLRGTPTAPGRVTATARVVRKLDEIGSVNPGDILITNSTDPGWTPVFLILGGVIVETGGLLSHSSCLAREYGFPAVQLADATALIEDGATVEVDGNTGMVTLVRNGGSDSSARQPVLEPAGS